MRLVIIDDEENEWYVFTNFEDFDLSEACDREQILTQISETLEAMDEQAQMLIEEEEEFEENKNV